MLQCCSMCRPVATFGWTLHMNYDVPFFVLRCGATTIKLSSAWFLETKLLHTSLHATEVLWCMCCLVSLTSGEIGEWAQGKVAFYSIVLLTGASQLQDRCTQPRDQS